MVLLSLGACGVLIGPRDAAYVQTPPAVVEAMLALAAVGPADYVVDLGSGDGRIPIAAARDHGARGLGIERDPALVEQSRHNAARAGVAPRVEFRVEDLFTADFSAATVVTLYLLPELNLRLRPRLLTELRPGTRIVSHDFDMGEWQADRYVFLEAAQTGVVRESRIFLWVVPAQVAGRWEGVMAGAGIEEPLVLELRQQFQTVSAQARIGGVAWTGGGRIQANMLSLDLGRSGSIDTDRLQVSVRADDRRLDGDATAGGRHAKVRAARTTP
jgi:SAM-dependent methyltransferase